MELHSLPAESRYFHEYKLTLTGSPTISVKLATTLELKGSGRMPRTRLGLAPLNVDMFSTDSLVEARRSYARISP